MARNQANSKKKVTLSGKGALRLAGILLAVGYVAVTLVHQQVTMAQCEKVAAEYKEKIAQEEIQNQMLEDELEKADTDEYLERLARDEYGMVKPNERVYIDITGE